MGGFHAVEKPGDVVEVAGGGHHELGELDALRHDDLRLRDGFTKKTSTPQRQAVALGGVAGDERAHLFDDELRARGASENRMHNRRNLFRKRRMAMVIMAIAKMIKAMISF